MEWIVTGNIPARVGSKGSKVKSIDKIRLFNDLRTAEFDSDDINNIIKILKERNYLYSAVASTSKVSIPIEDFLENFWDYDKSPYVKEKLGKKQSIHRQYCATLLSRSNGHTTMNSLRTIVLTESLSVLTSARNERFLIWKIQTNL